MRATEHAASCISATLRQEFEEDTIRVVNVMPGAVATNSARNFDPAVVAGFLRAAVAEAVFYAVTQPISIDVAAIVVRPPRQMGS